MARDVNECFSNAVKNYVLVLTTLFLTIQGTWSQIVKVQPEVVSYPGETVNLRCSFADKGDIQLTQVSWIWETTEGVRDNIAVYHPQFGPSYPDSPFTGRISFPNPSLENPYIAITNVKMTDEGSYICEFATYPTGNEQGITELVILAKPKNSATPVTVTAGEKPVVVARCNSENGKPPSQIKWVTVANGNGTLTSKTNADSTVTVSSEYRLVPKPAFNGKDISCVISHRTLEKPQSIGMKLAIEYPPEVDIVGYDNNWYMGRTNVELTCQATANPVPTSVVWKAMSGALPDSVQLKDNKMLVLKVDERVNTTFVCEVKNRLGVGKDQLTVMVRAIGRPMKGPTTGTIIGAIIGVIILLALIATAVALIRKHRNKKDADGPPNYKPPPPKKSASIEALNTSRGNVSESQPLGNLYYETNGEPAANLDAYSDRDPEYDDYPAPAGAPSGVDELPEPHYLRDEAPDEIDEPPYESPPDENFIEREEEADPHPLPNRGDSFMSPAMYV